MARKKKQKLDPEEVKAKVEEGARKVRPEDVERLVGREEEFHEKVRNVPGRLKKMVNQVRLLFEMIRAYVKKEYREVPWGTIALAAFAIIYFFSPVDLIPDFIPVVGYLDDAAVIALVVKSIQEDLRKYCLARGYDPDQYF
ncbi:MAG: DUF1232 domain-containing protein [Myxococcales bacterium]|nr:DUF1232 domain-containing protein [Myxococcales bacterium]